MATQAEAVRNHLTVVTSAATAEIAAVASQAPVEKRVATTLEAARLVVPSYYDAAGALAVTWYDERRDEAHPSSAYAPAIIGTPETDWIEREVEDFRKAMQGGDLEMEAHLLVAEATALVEKEVARGFRATIIGNTHADEDAVGWSRVARSGCCKFCAMLAARGAVFTEATVRFASHKNCHCGAQPEFRNGDLGPEASVMQYTASAKRRTPEQRGQLRAYLHEHYPSAPG